MGFLQLMSFAMRPSSFSTLAFLELRSIKGNSQNQTNAVTVFLLRQCLYLNLCAVINFRDERATEGRKK
jgi:hypothetical protein